MSSSEAQTRLSNIDTTRLPVHVAIIMDGNGRWAKRRGLPRLFGHREGTKSVRDIVEAAGQLGVKVLTLYAFSTENWARPKTEVMGLMKLLVATLKREEKHLHKNNVRLATIGDLTKLPESAQQQIEKTKQSLSVNTGLTLVLALNYGGRQEIVRAVNAALSAGKKTVSEQEISAKMDTHDWPDPDLMIRTSGEHRISNFLLWQLAYAEFYVTPVLWPDFRRQHFYQAVLDYQSRDRRYGGIR
jgi:undecaprenyl diphosphate synthase